MVALQYDGLWIQAAVHWKGKTVPGGFTDIELVPKVFNMGGVPRGSHSSIIRGVTEPMTGIKPKNLTEALAFVALWNGRQNIYVFHLLEEGVFPKRNIEKYQTKFNLEQL